MGKIYPLIGPKRPKTIPFRAAHTYMAYIREYFPPPALRSPGSLTRVSTLTGNTVFWIGFHLWEVLLTRGSCTWSFSCNHDWKIIPLAISFTLTFSGQTVCPEVNKVSSSNHSTDLWKKRRKKHKKVKPPRTFSGEHQRDRSTCLYYGEAHLF